MAQLLIKCCSDASYSLSLLGKSQHLVSRRGMGWFQIKYFKEAGLAPSFVSVVLCPALYPSHVPIFLQMAYRVADTLHKYFV